MTEATVTLPSNVALHQRPAAEFVRAAMRYTATVKVGYGDKEVDAKSLLGILTLGAEGGARISLRAEGTDAAEALNELTSIVAGLTE
jgi:phosphotransferase system HPr (HPr) family protein